MWLQKLRAAVALGPLSIYFWIRTKIDWYCSRNERTVVLLDNAPQLGEDLLLKYSSLHFWN